MPKKRKVTKRKTTRRRGRGRVGSFGGVDIESAALAMAGGLGGRVITNAMSNIKALKDEKTKAYVRVGVKTGISYFLMSRPSNEMKAAGFGLAAEAALDLAGTLAPKQFGPGTAVAGGVGKTVIDLDKMNGVGYANMTTDYGVAGANEDFGVAGVY